MGARRVLVTGAEGTIGTAVREHLGRPVRADVADADAAGVSEPRRRHRRPRRDPAGVRERRCGRSPGGLGVARSALGRRAAQQHRRHVQRLRGGASGRGRHAWCSRPRTTPSACTSSTARRASTTLDDERSYDHTAELRPDSLYGVSKVYGEALGRMYMERYGLRVFCLRIGAVRAHDDPTRSDRQSADRPRRRRAAEPAARRLAEPAGLRRADRCVSRRRGRVLGGRLRRLGECRAASGISTTPGSCSAGSRRTPRPSRRTLRRAVPTRGRRTRSVSRGCSDSRRRATPSAGLARVAGRSCGRRGHICPAVR